MVDAKSAVHLTSHFVSAYRARRGEAYNQEAPTSRRLADSFDLCASPSSQLGAIRRGRCHFDASNAPGGDG